MINSIKKYLNTLRLAGSISDNERKALLIYQFISGLNARRSSFGISSSEIACFNKILKCIKSRTCVLKNEKDFELLNSEQSYLYSRNGDIYYMPLSDTLSITTAVGDGRITLMQDGATIGEFTVNQAGNTEINISGGTPSQGSLSIRFSAPSNRSYFYGEVPSILFKWSIMANNTSVLKQNVYLNGVKVSEDSSIREYLAENVSDYCTLKVEAYSSEGNKFAVTCYINFYEKAYLFSRDNVFETKEAIAQYISSGGITSSDYFYAKESTNKIIGKPTSKNCYFAIPSSVNIISFKDEYDEELYPDSPDFLGSSDIDGKEYKFYRYINSVVEEDYYINIKIK